MIWTLLLSTLAAAVVRQARQQEESFFKTMPPDPEDLAEAARQAWHSILERIDQDRLTDQQRIAIDLALEEGVPPPGYMLNPARDAEHPDVLVEIFDPVIYELAPGESALVAITRVLEEQRRQPWRQGLKMFRLRGSPRDSQMPSQDRDWIVSDAIRRIVSVARSRFHKDGIPGNPHQFRASYQYDTQASPHRHGEPYRWGLAQAAEILGGWGGWARHVYRMGLEDKAGAALFEEVFQDLVPPAHRERIRRPLLAMFSPCPRCGTVLGQALGPGGIRQYPHCGECDWSAARDTGRDLYTWDLIHPVDPSRLRGDISLYRSLGLHVLQIEPVPNEDVEDVLLSGWAYWGEQMALEHGFIVGIASDPIRVVWGERSKSHRKISLLVTPWPDDPVWPRPEWISDEEQARAKAFIDSLFVAKRAH